MSLIGFFRPKLAETLRNYSSQDFSKDLIAGLPPAAPADPHQEEKRKLEAARQELTGALQRVNEVLQSGSETHRALTSAERTSTVASEKRDR